MKRELKVNALNAREAPLAAWESHEKRVERCNAASLRLAGLAPESHEKRVERSIILKNGGSEESCMNLMKRELKVAELKYQLNGAVLPVNLMKRELKEMRSRRGSERAT